MDHDVSDKRTGGNDSVAARRTRGNRVRRVVGVLTTLFVVSALICVGIVGYYTVRANQAIEQLRRDDTSMPAPYAGRPTTGGDAAPNAQNQNPAAKALNIAVLGSDSRKGERGRSDVMMIAHVPADRTRIHLVSIPRDSWVDVAGHGKAKINAAYAYGGPALAVRTLEQLTQVRIDHVVRVDFDGFLALTEAVDGVTVDNPIASSESGCTFAKGELTLRGHCALAYVRERKSLPAGDLDRAERQRLVLAALARKTLTPQVLANPVAFGRLVDTVSPLVTVDSGLTTARIRELALSLSLTSSDAFVTGQIPVTGVGTSPDGQSIVLVDQARMVAFRRALSADDLDAYWAAQR